MTRKYWVPAIERAHLVLNLIAEKPSSLKLIELSRELEINKSSMYSLLNTMEELGWVVRDKGDTYALGHVFGLFGNAFFQQFDLVEWFKKEAPPLKDRIGETLQMAKLQKESIVYLAKVEADTPVRLISEPGMTLPAHATAMGKMLLSGLRADELDAVYPEARLQPLTSKTIADKKTLEVELSRIRKRGYAVDDEEAVEGFCCVAAPVYNLSGKMDAAVSVSMPKHRWEEKREQAERVIRQLAETLSRKHGKRM